ncbi:hypothetical protein ES319_D13G131800v1 [Gossypium barbadense]|uniref:HMA domain-containing protein n=1 Tax=Gossypium barbadense TaxID=3634 RepID=A0A5J5NQL0_GOSBA|nr:hypothetical protein ES319_D13G131800v1 [Gossypium barbadense]
MEVVELKVRLHCKACEKAVRKSLLKINGVKCVEIDMTSSKITVLGYVDRKAWDEYFSPRLPKGFSCIIPQWGYQKV